MITDPNFNLLAKRRKNFAENGCRSGEQWVTAIATATIVLNTSSSLEKATYFAWPHWLLILQILQLKALYGWVSSGFKHHINKLKHN